MDDDQVARDIMDKLLCALENGRETILTEVPDILGCERPQERGESEVT